MRPAIRRLSAWRLALIAVVLAASVRIAGQSSASVLAMDGALHIRMPKLEFIDGAIAQRLQDGRSVRVDFEMVILERARGATVTRAQHSFNLSFDLWEQRYAVTRIGSPPRSISHLTARSAESWCLENAPVPLATLGRYARAPFWVRVEYRVQDRNPAADPEESTFTLRTLIDVLSKRRDDQQLSKSVEAGPFQLN